MQCNRTRSLDLFFATVTQATPPVLGLLGCGCSVASKPVAEIIHHWNISQVIESHMHALACFLIIESQSMDTCISTMNTYFKIQFQNCMVSMMLM